MGTVGDDEKHSVTLGDADKYDMKQWSISAICKYTAPD